jgi:hypothetical protein
MPQLDLLSQFNLDAQLISIHFMYILIILCIVIGFSLEIGKSFEKWIFS